MVKKLLIGLSLALLSVGGFASTFVLGSILTKRCQVSAEFLSFFRFLAAGVIILAFSVMNGRERQKLSLLSRGDWLFLAAIGPIGTSIMAWCVFKGCSMVSAANASMADALAPLLVYVFAAVYNRNVCLREIVGVLTGFAGALLVMKVVSAAGINLNEYSIGDVYIFFAAATWGIYTVLGRDLIRKVGAIMFTGLTMCLGAIFMLPFLFFSDICAPQDVNSWQLLALLCAVSTLMPFWAWNAAQKYLPVSILAMTAYFTPIFAVAIAAITIGEIATPCQWLGTIIIIIASILNLKSMKSADNR